MTNQEFQNNHEALEGKPENTLAWVPQVGEAGLSLIKLIKAEITLSFNQIPSLLAYGLMIIHFCLLLWLSLCLILSWSIASLFDAVLSGLITFFVLQLIGLLFITRKLHAIWRSMLLPYTRKNISEIVKSVNEYSIHEKPTQ